MRISHLSLVIATASLLAACQTVEQSATLQATSVCSANGWGPGRPGHESCVSQMKPMAQLLEQQRRDEQFQRGIALVARGLHPPPPATVTCIQEGAVTRCY